MLNDDDDVVVPTSHLPPACVPLHKIPVWRDGPGIWKTAPDGKIIIEEGGPPYAIWTGRCLCGVASQGVSAETAQEAIAEACRLTKYWKTHRDPS